MLQALALAAVLAQAQAAPVPPAIPLRTLIYATEYDVVSRRERLNSPVANATQPRATAAPAGYARPPSAIAGRLRIDLIAVEPDGIVFDTSLSGGRVQPTIRVGVTNDGLLRYDAAGGNLSPEVRRLMPLMARGLLADRHVESGVTWRVPEDPPMQGESRTTVVHANAEIADLRIDRDRSDLHGYDDHAVITVVYARRLLDPRSFTYEARIRRPAGLDAVETTRVKYTAELVSDSVSP